MYKLKAPIIYPNDKEIPFIRRLFKEVLGYTNEEIEQFVSSNFQCAVAEHLTLEQISLIAKPFEDYDALVLYIVDENTKRIVSYNEAGINLTKEPPKDHYYDHPVVSRDQLVNPLTQKAIERQEILSQPDSAFYANIPKCPTCGSPDVEKISLTSKVVGGALFGLFSSNVRKTMHCKNCGYKW